MSGRGGGQPEKVLVQDDARELSVLVRSTYSGIRSRDVIGRRGRDRVETRAERAREREGEREGELGKTLRKSAAVSERIVTCSFSPRRKPSSNMDTSRTTSGNVRK